MNDKRRSLFFPADPKNPDTHAENELNLLKEKLKRRQSPNLDAESVSNCGGDGKAVTISRTEDPDPIEDNLFVDIRRSLAEDEKLNQGNKKKGVFSEVGRIINFGKTTPFVDLGGGESKKDDKIDGKSPAEDDHNSMPNANSLSAEDTITTEPELPSTDQNGTGEIEPATTAQQGSGIHLHPDPEKNTPDHVQNDIPSQMDLKEKGILKKEQESKHIRTLSKQEATPNNFDDIRDVVLEDYDESAAPLEEMSGVFWFDKLKDWTRGLTVLDKILLTIIVVLLIATGMTGFGVKIINAQTSERPSAPVEVAPYPVRITLPGGWDFKLDSGQVVNGKWSPEGAEWLESTELCKWIAIPWTTQLEAVVRTLQPNDEIQLIMSNADALEFKVLSIENVSADQVGGLDRTTPSLLLILVNKNVDTRWVVTALSE